MNNCALKYFGWSYEGPARLRRIPGEGVEFDVTKSQCITYPPTHADRGGKYWFEASVKQPWSWRHLPGSLRKGQREGSAVQREVRMLVDFCYAGSSVGD